MSQVAHCSDQEQPIEHTESDNFYQRLLQVKKSDDKNNQRHMTTESLVS